MSGAARPDGVEPFVLATPQADLDDLRARLARARFPDRETVDDASQGVPLADLRALCDYWRTEYDWRRCEAKLNAWGQNRTEFDGLPIHFLHVRSPEPRALPLLMTHGWPGSVIEFHKVIGPLTDPVAHGGRTEDAFHLVTPSLPGYGFSGKPERTGWDAARTARAWSTLMPRLGYQRYVAQGGDWGAVVTNALARLEPPGLAAVHVNAVTAHPTPADLENLDEREKAAVADFKTYVDRESAYASIQATRPQTLGYGLADSPAGQAAWIFEKFCEWSGCGGDIWSCFTRDEILDNITLYWLTNTGASSARYYWETWGASENSPIALPYAATIFPREIIRPSRRWAERTFTNIVYWNEAELGGHFAAFERPEIFVRELRAAFRQFR